MIIKIPEERRAVIIGKKGKTKKYLETRTHTKITVSDDVEIESRGKVIEGIIIAAEVIKAIARGFSPEKAFKLLEEGCSLAIISFEGESEKKLKRLFGRVIGKEGSARRIIEESTNTYVSVYGKTISVIGRYDDAHKATRAIEDLLKGKSHGVVYNFLMKKG